MNGNTSIPLADQLTATQKKALKLDGSMAIAAGPGSGKSTTLVIRYLKAVRACDYDVSRVLAVTFTKKAAAELSKRIRDKVRLLATGRAVLDASSDDAARWADVLDHLPDAWVTTLHGFCQRYLATLPPDEELGYRFAVIESEAPNHPAGDVIDALIAEAALAGGGGHRRSSIRLRLGGSIRRKGSQKASVDAVATSPCRGRLGSFRRPHRRRPATYRKSAARHVYGARSKGPREGLATSRGAGRCGSAPSGTARGSRSSDFGNPSPKTERRFGCGEASSGAP